MGERGQAGDRGSRRLALIRLGAYGLLIAIVLAVVVLTGSFPSAEEIRDWGESLGPFAAVACIPAFVLLNFVITWPVLAGATGLLFGTAAGTPLALAGVVGAALAQMAVTRYLAGEHAGSLIPRRVQRLEQFLQRSGTVAVMESRIVPALPYGAVNYAAGVTTLRFRQMALGTAVGAAPKVFGYVALGGSLDNLGAPEAKVAIALLAVLALVGAIVARGQLQAERAA
jgi:uncharacterized membrane protein YdjX (TVP38/TMEM64 family)